jgi:uncharacterized membrane protein
MSSESAEGQRETVPIDEVLEELDDLEEVVDTPEERAEVNDVRRTLEKVPSRHFVGDQIERYTIRDVAEGFIGSVLFSLPLLVEDGVFDVGDHLVSATAFGLPVWLLGNVVFIFAMTWGLLYWTDFKDVNVRNPIGGFLPRRVLGVLLISLGTATATMTMWGRVGGWSDPALALARITVIWTGAAFGAALSDILSGPSSGTTIGDVIDTD